MQAAAHALDLQLTVLDASTEGEIDAVFASLARQKVDALLINTDPFLFGQRVDAGGLMSYGPNINNGYRQAGIYVGADVADASVSTRSSKQCVLVLLRAASSARIMGDSPVILSDRADVCRCLFGGETGSDRSSRALVRRRFGIAGIITINLLLPHLHKGAGS